MSEVIRRMVFAFPAGDSRRADIEVTANRVADLELEVRKLRGALEAIADLRPGPEREAINIAREALR
jgi:hypothetical protein